MDLTSVLLKVGGVTLVTRLTSLLREILIACVYGANKSTDAFYISTRVPNMLRRASSDGAFNQAFLPLLTQYDVSDPSDARRFVGCAAAGMTAALCGASMACCLWAPWVTGAISPELARASVCEFARAVYMLRVALPYSVATSMGSVLSCVLNAYRCYALPAFAPTLLNVTFAAIVTVASSILKAPICSLPWALVLGSAAQCAAYYPALRSTGAMPAVQWGRPWGHPGVRRVAARMVPGLITMAAVQASLLLNTNLAGSMGEGLVSGISYADKLLEFSTGLFGGSLGSILLPSLSISWASGDGDGYSAIMNWGLAVVTLATAPNALLFSLLPELPTAAFFNYGLFDAHTVKMVTRPLATSGPGMVGMLASRTLSLGLYARHDVGTPVVSSLLCILLSQASGRLLLRPMGHAGLAMGSSIGALLNAALLLRSLHCQGAYAIRPMPWAALCARISASAAMAGVLLCATARSIDWVGMSARPARRACCAAAILWAFLAAYAALLWCTGLRRHHLYAPADIRRCTSHPRRPAACL
ncbi:putative peptidoglycan biosynthesis protein MurJ [Candidatus Tremblaya princeps]|uniref:Lipid II flippase n=1 Tax=Tremblaya princeps TaxID=189385 RepID=A0A143WNG4_TREPR|nr:putative peptidoglycan biosynthesis protein MurJ [Candidatus Tremblaya princeps]